MIRVALVYVMFRQCCARQGSLVSPSRENGEAEGAVPCASGGRLASEERAGRLRAGRLREFSSIDNPGTDGKNKRGC